jgi:tRNA dimethylallyltransferase
MDEVVMPFERYILKDTLMAKYIESDEIKAKHNLGIAKLAIELIKRNTRHYARKQLTWFRKDNEINWFDLDNDKLFYEFVQKKISEK